MPLVFISFNHGLYLSETRISISLFPDIDIHNDEIIKRVLTVYYSKNGHTPKVEIKVDQINVTLPDAVLQKFPDKFYRANGFSKNLSPHLKLPLTLNLSRFSFKIRPNNFSFKSIDSHFSRISSSFLDLTKSIGPFVL